MAPDARGAAFFIPPPAAGFSKLACFDYNGHACAPGSPGCPCDYLQTYGNATTFASPSESRGFYQCLVCPPMTRGVVVNAPAPPSPPPPANQGVEYGVCNTVFQTLYATNAPFNPGGWTGLVSCTTDPSKQNYWVGDAVECVRARSERGQRARGGGACALAAVASARLTRAPPGPCSAGASMACFNAYGGKCMPGTTGCPCVYNSTYGKNLYAGPNTGNTNAQAGAGKCVVCPPPAPTTTTAATPPGVVYAPCNSAAMAGAGVPSPQNAGGSFSGMAYCSSVPNSPGYWVGDANECVPRARARAAAPCVSDAAATAPRCALSPKRGRLAVVLQLPGAAQRGAARCGAACRTL